MYLSSRKHEIHEYVIDTHNLSNWAIHVIRGARRYKDDKHDKHDKYNYQASLLITLITIKYI